MTATTAATAARHALPPNADDDLRETLLCLHSSGSSGRQWAGLLPLLSPRLHMPVHLMGAERSSLPARQVLA